MKSQQQRVPHSGAPISSSVPNAQLAPLEEVVDRVNSAVEVTTREFQCLTSWLLHRGERRSKESHGCSHLKNERSQQNMATGSHQEQFRAKREGCSRNPRREEIQRRQPNNEQSQERYCPADRLHSSSLSSSYHNWPNHLGRGEAERDMPSPKGEREEVTPPSGKETKETPYADQVTIPYFSSNSQLPLIKSYDGRGNPASHIDKFQTHPSLCNLPGEIACHIFPLTLEGRAREWFNSLSPCTNFSTIKHQFLRQFSNVPRKETTSCLSVRPKTRPSRIPDKFREKVLPRATVSRQPERPNRTLGNDQRNKTWRTNFSRTSWSTNHLYPAAVLRQNQGIPAERRGNEESWEIVETKEPTRRIPTRRRVFIKEEKGSRSYHRTRSISESEMDAVECELVRHL
jgi:hypothetical protein